MGLTPGGPGERSPSRLFAERVSEYKAQCQPEPLRPKDPGRPIVPPTGPSKPHDTAIPSLGQKHDRQSNPNPLEVPDRYRSSRVWDSRAPRRPRTIVPRIQFFILVTSRSTRPSSNNLPTLFSGW